MYLKRVEAIGFKSFAHKVNIGFTPGINGIVGPNGCGKSNITDAIKWVLGEQSTKNLRAQGMSDVIFAGSQDYKAQNMAQVSLVFDNSDKLLKLDYEEVEITRRLYRSGESEYSINKNSCRLKDIVDLLMDTGLGRDSLSMISQGAIANFAQAKPIERRGIFEEAAGVSKYKKRKIEALRKLEKTNENLLRISDIINELEDQIGPLKRQADNARKFLEKKERLDKIEVSVIVFDVANIERILIEAKENISTIKQELTINETKLLFDEGKLEQLKENIKTYDNEIAMLQAQLLSEVDKISSLEKQKSEEDSRDNENKSVEYIDGLKQKLNALAQELDGFNNNLKLMSVDLDELKISFEDKKSSYDDLKENIARKQNMLHNYQNKKGVLDNINDNKSNVYTGVKAIMEVKNSLSGIVGMVNDLFEVEEQFQDAISKSLAASLQNIVVESNNDAKRAVSFLKTNKAGRATFIPIDTIRARYINGDDIYVAQQSEGFIDVATNLIRFDEENRIVFEYLLNTTLVCDQIDNAVSLARALKNRYRVITLDGDIISVGGLVTGGKIKNDRGNILTIKKDLEKITEYISKITSEIQSDNEELYVQEQDLNNIRNKINQQNISIAKVEESISHRQHQFDDLKNEFESISNESYVQDFSQISSVVERLNSAKLNKERILSAIKSARETHSEINLDIENIETQLKSTRYFISDLEKKHSNINMEKATKEIELKNMLDRLANEYQLTIDGAKEQVVLELDMRLAKEEVVQLKREIKNLGMVNPLAIEEYERVSERFNFLSDQREDLETSKNDILDMINDTDKIMVEKFSKTIDDINKELPDTFSKLFGGGSVKLEYTDPSNLLETGIDIVAQPPGKSIKNLNLFSGGEKALIALSVLFAILKVRPIPLCILDEVEAALDQANVERFAKFLKEFSSET
ncbi:MAG: AAA family ATPase, partial [Erysipelotrichales bacterium]